MTTYVHLDAKESDLFDPNLNPEIRIITLDYREQNVDVGDVQVAIAMHFPTDEYPTLKFRDTPLFKDIVSEWMLENWGEGLSVLVVQIMFSESNCRQEIDLLHDVAASFEAAIKSAQFRRMELEQYNGVARAHSFFRLDMYVFSD